MARYSGMSYVRISKTKYSSSFPRSLGRTSTPTNSKAMILERGLRTIRNDLRVWFSVTAFAGMEK
jgi:hypothetical protein